MNEQPSSHQPPSTTPRQWERYRHLELFRDVNPAGLEGLLENCFEAVYRRGEILLRAGSENRFIYLVLAGRLVVKLEGREASPLVELGPGARAGEMSILSHVNVSAHVVVVEDARLLVVDQEILWSMIDASHGVARNLLYVLSGRIRQVNERLLESAASLERFEQYATVDALTGLHNRRWLDDMLAHEIIRCRRDDIPLSVAMVDVDHFKGFNDTHGHVAGDEALRAVAGVFDHHLRPVDTAARYGGEEFTVLMRGVTAEGAGRIAERLRRQIAATPIPWEGAILHVTVSIGVADGVPDDTPNDLVGRADAALYRAKTNGRDRVETGLE